MSKKIKCPSCDMSGDPQGDDYKLVTTYHGRPVLQCFWCDTHMMIRKVGGALVLDLNHKAIRHLREDLGHDQMVSLLLDEEEAAEGIAVIAHETPAPQESIPALEAELLQPVHTESPKPRRSRKPVADPAPELDPFLQEAFQTPAEALQPAFLTDAPPADNTPAVLPSTHDDRTPVSTEAELVSSIPVTARALDHDSLIHIAKQVGWNYTPVRKQPEWMNFELPAPVEMGPLRTKIQGTINMIKYFRINAGSREQRRAETLARRQRLMEYRRRMFDSKLDALGAMKSIEYKPEAV